MLHAAKPDVFFRPFPLLTTASSDSPWLLHLLRKLSLIGRVLQTSPVKYPRTMSKMPP